MCVLSWRLWPADRDGRHHRIRFEFEKGTTARHYEEVAMKRHLDPLEVSRHASVHILVSCVVRSLSMLRRRLCVRNSLYPTTLLCRASS
jgi:hypothetical protein